MIHSSVVLAVIAMLGYGLDGGLAQDVAKGLGATRTIFWRCSFLSLILGVIALFSSNTITLNYALLGLLIACLGYLPILAFYKALRIGKLGIVFPIASSSSLFSILLAILFLGEHFTGFSYLALALVVGGNIGLGLDFKTLRQKRLVLNAGTAYALLACVGWGVVFFLYKYPTDALGPSLSAFIIEIGVLLAAGVHLAVTKNKIEQKVKQYLPRLICMAIFAALGVSFFTVALRQGPVSVVTSIVLANGGVGLLYGRLFKDERLKSTQYIAASMTITGIVMLGSVSR